MLVGTGVGGKVLWRMLMIMGRYSARGAAMRRLEGMRVYLERGDKGEWGGGGVREERGRGRG